MKIAINARFTGLEYIEGYGRFTNGLINAFKDTHPQDEISLLYDRQPVYPPAFPFLVKGPKARHPLLWKLWYDYSLPAMAKKMKADILFSPDGFCSLTTKIPQVLAIHDLAFHHYPAGISAFYRNYYKHYTPAFIQKARHIITVSEFSKEDIIRHYPQAAEKITVVYNAADPGFQPLNSEEKEIVKDKITNGVEYFLYAGAIHPRKNIINLLKGFSWFKNRHKSNIKLMLAGRAWNEKEFEDQLQRYKFKDDVVMLGYVSDPMLHKLTAAAYALVYPSHWEGFGLPILEAMHCGTPVICSNTSSLPEITDGAAVYCSPDDPEAFGKAMGLLYKDEDHRAQLIHAGLIRSKSFSWEKSARSLREVFAKIG